MSLRALPPPSSLVIGIIRGTTLLRGLSSGKSIPVAELEALNEDTQVYNWVIG
jgi:hypothetical protein